MTDVVSGAVRSLEADVVLKLRSRVACTEPSELGNMSNYL